MSSSSTLCVDASLVIRLVLKQSDVVQELWENWASEEYRLAAPALLYYEVTNGIYRYQKAGLIRPATAQEALGTALALPVELVRGPDLHERARKLATQYNLSAAYDAHYLALAEWMDAEFWTADSRLVNTLKPHKLAWVKGIDV